MSLTALSADASEFLTKSQAVGKKYQDVIGSPESLQLLQEGRGSEVNARLKALVPDESKTVYDYFTLSNMLYRVDGLTSKAYIEKANELSPNNPFILYELAMQEHRSGNCKAALPIYEKAGDKVEKSGPDFWSYVTHCHLVLGNYAAAIESWRKVDFRNHHISVEKAMYEIFSNKDPHTEREKHINAVHTGIADAACELIELDRNWEVDWWNVNEAKAYLKHDIALVKNLLKKNKQLQGPIGICVDSITLKDGEFRKYITDSGYWGRKYLVPEGPMTTYFLIRALNKREVATPTEILEHYEDQLIKRHVADPSNLRTLDILAFLYSATRSSDKLKKIDAHGWKNLGLQKYAESYIFGISSTDPEFRETVETAAEQFPNSSKIQKAYFTIHQESDLREKSLMQYVAAEFANVKNHLRGKFRLNDYMASLKHEVETASKATEQQTESNSRTEVGQDPK